MVSDEVAINILDRQESSGTISDDEQRRDAVLAGREIYHFGNEDQRFRTVVFLDEAYNDMLRFGMEDRGVELGGALFGFHCGDQTIITRFVGSRIAEGRAGEIDFTPEVWADLHVQNDELDRLNGTNYTMMAWFHTHPENWPSAPYTTNDRSTMSNHFSVSDKDAIDDRSTMIITTVAGNPTPIVATWKWDSRGNSAVLVDGIDVATRTGSSVQPSSYYSPENESARVIGNALENVMIDLDEPAAADTANQSADVFRLELDQQPGEVVTIELEDLNPDPNVLEISPYDVTPPIAKQLVDYLNKNPDGRVNKVARSLLRAAQTILPADLQKDINLVLEQTTPIEEQITILSKFPS